MSLTHLPHLLLRFLLLSFHWQVLKLLTHLSCLLAVWFHFNLATPKLFFSIASLIIFLPFVKSLWLAIMLYTITAKS